MHPRAKRVLDYDTEIFCCHDLGEWSVGIVLVWELQGWKWAQNMRTKYMHKYTLNNLLLALYYKTDHTLLYIIPVMSD